MFKILISVAFEGAVALIRERPLSWSEYETAALIRGVAYLWPGAYLRKDGKRVLNLRDLWVMWQVSKYERTVIIFDAFLETTGLTLRGSTQKTDSRSLFVLKSK